MVPLDVYRSALKDIDSKHERGSTDALKEITEVNLMEKFYKRMETTTLSVTLNISEPVI
jgi:hypothetical protein